MIDSPLLQNFILQLERREIHGSGSTAAATATLMRTLISQTRWSTAEQLMQMIKQVAVVLSKAQPIELAVGNILRRILFVIREAYKEAMNEDEAEQPMRNLSLIDNSSMYNLLAFSNDSIDYSIPRNNLKMLVLQEMKDIIDDLECSKTLIAAQSLDQIHSNEIIMTVGNSKYVQEFLLTAAKKRKFQVIVADSAPSFRGHEMAAVLVKANIETTVISDSAIFAIMARVNKVILGCHAVTANGGVVAISGTTLVTVAAKHFSIPVVVLAGIHKLSPVYPFDRDSYNLFPSPNSVMPFNCPEFKNEFDVIDSLYDYVLPDTVDLFLTNFGGYAPSYMYRMLEEYYDPRDYIL